MSTKYKGREIDGENHNMFFMTNTTEVIKMMQSGHVFSDQKVITVIGIHKSKSCSQSLMINLGALFCHPTYSMCTWIGIEFIEQLCSSEKKCANAD